MKARLLMFDFSQEQLDAMLQQDEGEFISFIVKHLHEESPELVDGITPIGLREMVANGLARARRHGLRRPGDLTAFVSVMFEIAPNFDDQPSLRRILESESVPADQKIDRLFSPALDAAWEEAARNYDQAAWFPEVGPEPDDPDDQP